MHPFYGLSQPRFADGIYRDCRFCRGKGCLSCPEEADREYKRQFPNGAPEPIATFKVGDEPGALGMLLDRLVGPAALADARTVAQERAGEMMDGPAGSLVRGVLAGFAGGLVSASPTAEETREVIASALVGTVLTENIVAKAEQFALEQGDLFAASEPPKGKSRPKRRKRSGDKPA